MVNYGVTIKVHPLYFDNVFERRRKKLEKKLKMPISQVKFTEYMAKRIIKKRYKNDNKHIPRGLGRKRYYV